MQALLDALPVLAQAEDVTHYWLPRRWLYGEPRPLARRAALAAGLPAAARAQRPARAVVPDRDARPGEGARAVPLPRRRLLPPRHAAQLARGAGGEGAALRALAPWEARRGAAAERGVLRAGARRSADRGGAGGGPRVDRAGCWPASPGGRRAREVGTVTREEIDAHWNEARSVRGGALVPRGRTAAARRRSREGGRARREPLRAGRGQWDGEIRLGSRWLARARRSTASGRRCRPTSRRARRAACRSRSSRRPPGPWTLEVDLVHEHVRWFDQPIRAEVEVLPARRVAVVDPGTLDGLVDAARDARPRGGAGRRLQRGPSSAASSPAGSSSSWRTPKLAVVPDQPARKRRWR